MLHYHSILHNMRLIWMSECYGVYLQKLERWHVGEHCLLHLGESPVDEAPARMKGTIKQ